MKKQFIVIEEGTSNCYVVDDLKKLIEEMYEEYTGDAEAAFYRVHKIIEVVGEIREIN